MHSWISSITIQNSGLISHCFLVFAVTVRSPNYKIQPKCSYSFIHGLLKTIHFPFPHPTYKIQPKCSNSFIHGLLKTIKFPSPTQTTKFSPNAQILSSAAYSKQSAVASLLRLWVRIPPGAWMSVCCECCVLSGRGLCDELITRSDESCRMLRVIVNDLETAWMRKHWPTGGCSAKNKQNTPTHPLGLHGLLYSELNKKWHFNTLFL
jgi:hypothetical protein